MSPFLEYARVKFFSTLGTNPVGQFRGARGNEILLNRQPSTVFCPILLAIRAKRKHPFQLLNVFLLSLRVLYDINEPIDKKCDTDSVGDVANNRYDQFK